MMEQPIKRGGAFWDAYFMDVAIRTAQLSKDPDRKVGAVLVTADRRQMSVGYNGLPAGMPDLPSALDDKEQKLRHMVHAEDNCLHQAPFYAGGCSLYVTRFPCRACAEMIAAVGVAHLVAPRPNFGHLRWGESWIQAYRLMQVAGVHVRHMEVEDGTL